MSTSSNQNIHTTNYPYSYSDRQDCLVIVEVMDLGRMGISRAGIQAIAVPYDRLSQTLRSIHRSGRRVCHVAISQLQLTEQLDHVSPQATVSKDLTDREAIAVETVAAMEVQGQSEGVTQKMPVDCIEGEVDHADHGIESDSLDVSLDPSPDPSPDPSVTIQVSVREENSFAYHTNNTNADHIGDSIQVNLPIDMEVTTDFVLEQITEHFPAKTVGQDFELTVDSIGESTVESILEPTIELVPEDSLEPALEAYLAQPVQTIAETVLEQKIEVVPTTLPKATKTRTSAKGAACGFNKIKLVDGNDSTTTNTSTKSSAKSSTKSSRKTKS